MSKELTLTISERVAAAKILNSFKGDLTQLALFLTDMKSIAVTSEEWTTAGLTKTALKDAEGNATGQETWNWTDEGNDKTITIDAETVLFLLSQIKAMEEAKTITMADIPLITLCGG